VNEVTAGQRLKLSLLNPLIFRLIWIPLLLAESIAQFVFHRQDIVTVLAAVLLSVIAIRWALISAARTAYRKAGGGQG
jgi:hypothetical protein